MNQTLNGIRRILITILVAMGVGALFIVAIGENPIDAYAALFRGAFDGELRLGTTLAGFTPLLLTSIAFAVAAKAGAFNVGVEGEVFLGGLYRHQLDLPSEAGSVCGLLRRCYGGSSCLGLYSGGFACLL